MRLTPAMPRARGTLKPSTGNEWDNAGVPRQGWKQSCCTLFVFLWYYPTAGSPPAAPTSCISARLISNMKNGLPGAAVVDLK